MQRTRARGRVRLVPIPGPSTVGTAASATHRVTLDVGGFGLLHVGSGASILHAEQVPL